MKHIICLFAVFTLSVGCGGEVAGPPGPGDLLVPEFNQSFEEATDTGRIAHWGSDRWGWKVFRTNDCSEGEWGVLFTQPLDVPVESEIVLFSSRFDMTPGATYAFSFAAETPPGTSIRTEIQWVDDLSVCLTRDGVACAGEVVQTSESDAYRYYTAAVQVPASTRGVARGDIRFVASLPSGARAYVDDVRLRPWTELAANP